MNKCILPIAWIVLVLPVFPQAPDAGQNPADAAKPAAPAPTPPGQYVPITAEQRVTWALQGALSPRGIGAGLINAGLQTWRDRPPEWDTHWEGFGKRFATRQATILMSNTIESSLGAIWGEDPRYRSSNRQGFGPRLKWAVSSAFLTYRRDGTRDIAYARFIGVVSARAISSTWRPESDRVWYRNSLQPFGTGLLFRGVSNIAREFLPDLLGKVKKR